MIEIETPRLRLRRFRPDDAAALAAYRSDPDIARYQIWESPLTPAGAAAVVERYMDQEPDEPGWFQYAIELHDRPGLVGDLGVDLDDNRLQAELGITLSPALHHQGYATEALTAIAASLFGQGLHRLSAECDARNTASARMLERVGFQREGLRPEYTWNRGEWSDAQLYGLLSLFLIVDCHAERRVSRGV
ncbi:GNAT family N-acetyltransferase [Streptomyces sp. NPDC001205]